MEKFNSNQTDYHSAVPLDSDKKKIRQLEKELAAARNEIARLKNKSTNWSDSKTTSQEFIDMGVIAIAENIPARMLYIDKSLTVRYANKASASISTTPYDEMVGSKIIDLIGKKTFNALEEAYRRVLAGETVQFEFVKEKENALGRDLSSVVNYIPRWRDGEVVGFFSLGVDITDLRSTREQLAQTSKQLRTISDNLPAWVSYVDKDLIVRYVNNRYEAVLGLQTNQIIGRHVSSFGSQEGFNQSKIYYDQALAGSLVQYEMDLPATVHRDFLSIAFTLIPDHDAERPNGFYVIGVDQTKEVKAKAQERETSELLQNLINHLPAFVALFDKEYRFKFANSHFESIASISYAKLIGKTIAESFPGPVFDLVKPNLDRALSGETVVAERTIAYLEDAGSSILATYSPIYSADEVSGVLIHAADVSDLRRATNEIEKLNGDLTEINISLEKRVQERTQSLDKMNMDLRRTVEELDRFAHVAAHDLKEPLRGLQNYAKLLEVDHGERLSEEGLNLINSIKVLSLQVETLLDDLRGYSRIGRKRDAVLEVDLNTVFDQALAILSPLIEEHRPVITKVNRLPTIFTQKSHALTILQNLISNGIKYNTAAEKTIQIGQVTAESHPDINLQDGPVIFVSDNGIGIAPQHAKQIFDIFRRLHPKEHYGGGTGAGLAIVRKIVEFNHGDIWVESDVGRGSTFFVRLNAPQTRIDA